MLRKRLLRWAGLSAVVDFHEELYKLQAGIFAVQEELDYLKSSLEVPKSWADEFIAWRSQHRVSKEPFVSVCVATYNRARTLSERCIPSILGQTYENFELIIVGDACDDETAEVVNRIGDPRVSFVNLPERGQYPADPMRHWMVAGTVPMNHALSLASGEYITHLDDDDEYMSTRLNDLIEFARENDADLVWHPFWLEEFSGEWRVLDAQFFAKGSVTTGSVLYRSWFKRIPWDLDSHKLWEPGDWNRFRKIKYLNPRLARYPEPLLRHHREHLPR